MNGKQKILVLIVILQLLVGALYSQDVAYSPENQLDLNNATFEQITRLPIPLELAEKIYTRILYQGPLSSVYELNQIEGVDPAIFLTIKPLLKIEPYIPRSGREERLEDLYYRLSRWEGDEGVSQSLVDLWIERSLEPFDINQIRYDELINLQNVSPVDAAAVVAYRNQVGSIYSERDLLSAPYISY